VPRIQERAASWLDPWGRPFAAGFQFVRGEFALASGGLVGVQELSPASLAPEVQTDFALVGIGTLFGSMTAAGVIALSCVLIVRCATNALQASDGLHRLLAIGLTALLALQMILIVGGTLRLLPLTGVTLPLVSYGGTSMLVTLFSLGLIGGCGAARRAAR
jgi:cell division protein FtsW (lipid II flippase)